jgi:hypothetical protein
MARADSTSSSVGGKPPLARADSAISRSAGSALNEADEAMVWLHPEMTNNEANGVCVCVCVCVRARARVRMPARTCH